MADDWICPMESCNRCRTAVYPDQTHEGRHMCDDCIENLQIELEDKRQALLEAVNRIHS